MTYDFDKTLKVTVATNNPLKLLPFVLKVDK